MRAGAKKTSVALMLFGEGADLSHPTAKGVLDLRRHCDGPKPDYRMHALARCRHEKSWIIARFGKKLCTKSEGKKGVSLATVAM